MILLNFHVIFSYGYYHSIPDPTHLNSALPPPKKTAAKSKAKQVSMDPTVLFVKPRIVSAILVPSGLGVQDWSSFGQCLCIDWFPGNQHTRIAAGYYNGTSIYCIECIVVYGVNLCGPAALCVNLQLVDC